MFRGTYCQRSRCRCSVESELVFLTSDPHVTWQGVPLDTSKLPMDQRLPPYPLSHQQQQQQQQRRPNAQQQLHLQNLRNTYNQQLQHLGPVGPS